MHRIIMYFLHKASNTDLERELHLRGYDTDLELEYTVNGKPTVMLAIAKPKPSVKKQKTITI